MILAFFHIVGHSHSLSERRNRLVTGPVRLLSHKDRNIGGTPSQPGPLDLLRDLNIFKVVVSDTSTCDSTSIHGYGFVAFRVISGVDDVSEKTLSKKLLKALQMFRGTSIFDDLEKNVADNLILPFLILHISKIFLANIL